MLILDDWTCLPANALQVHLTPPQLLPHFIFSQKKQMFLSAPDFKYKRCSISPEQDFSNAASAVPNLKFSTNGGPSAGNSCTDRLTGLAWKPHTPTPARWQLDDPNTDVDGGLQNSKQKGDNKPLTLLMQRVSPGTAVEAALTHGMFTTSLWGSVLS